MTDQHSENWIDALYELSSVESQVTWNLSTPQVNRVPTLRGIRTAVPDRSIPFRLQNASKNLASTKEKSLGIYLQIQIKHYFRHCAIN